MAFRHVLVAAVFKSQFQFLTKYYFIYLADMLFQM